MGPMAVTYSHQSVSSQFPSFVSFFFFFPKSRLEGDSQSLPPLPPPVSCTFPTFLPHRWIFDDRVNYSCKFTSRGQHNCRVSPQIPSFFFFSRVRTIVFVVINLKGGAAPSGPIRLSGVSIPFYGVSWITLNRWLEFKTW